MPGTVEESPHIGFIPPGDVHYQHTCNTNTKENSNEDAERIQNSAETINTSCAVLLKRLLLTQETECKI